MVKYLFCSIVFIFSASSFADVLSAVMTYESKVVTTEGVTKQTRFQESFIRTPQAIWSERIAPATAHDHSDTENTHDHNHDLNLALAGKWLSLDTHGQTTLKFVREEGKTIIQPRASEYGTLGFDGSWELAYYLVDRNALKKMAIINKPAPRGATWHEKKDDKSFTRVLWDEKKQIPLSIESGKFDGTINDKITLAMVTAPKILPWNALAKYKTIDYEDLLD